MENKAISPFQMKSYKSHRFEYSAPSSNSLSDIKIHHDFAGKFATEYISDRWLGMIMVHYSAKAESESEPFSVDIIMDGVYEYNAPNSPEEQAKFKKLLTMNGAVALFTIMRGQVATTTTALGLNPGLIVPSINLNHFVWQEQDTSSASE